MDFSNASLLHVTIRDSKLPGALFSECRARDVRIENCVAMYSTFDLSNLRDVTIIDTDLSGSSLSYCKAERLSIISSSLVRASLRSTPLSSVDLSSSDIEGIALSENLKELRGARLDAGQALSIVRMLGAEIG